MLNGAMCSFVDLHSVFAGKVEWESRMKNAAVAETAAAALRDY
jgi:hypothetical protein